MGTAVRKTVHRAGASALKSRDLAPDARVRAFYVCGAARRESRKRSVRLNERSVSGRRAPCARRAGPGVRRRRPSIASSIARGRSAGSSTRRAQASDASATFVNSGDGWSSTSGISLRVRPQRRRDRRRASRTRRPASGRCCRRSSASAASRRATRDETASDCRTCSCRRRSC